MTTSPPDRTKLPLWSDGKEYLVQSGRRIWPVHYHSDGRHLYECENKACLDKGAA